MSAPRGGATQAKAIPAALYGRTPIHPWLHADAHGVIVGRLDEDGQVELVTSDRQRIPAEDCPAGALVRAPRWDPELVRRWTTPDVETWCASGAAPSLGDVLRALVIVYRRYLEFPRVEHAAVLATWTLATYFHQDFLALPRLALSGERGTGKSKVGQLLAALGFNGMLLLQPTPAVMFRLIESYRPTLVLDEMESLDKDDRHDILGLINAGYKRAGVVRRVEGKEERRVESFAVYGPLAMSAIRAPNPTTEDRCLPIVMQRGLDAAHINLDVDAADADLADVRHACHRVLLTHWRAVRCATETVLLPDWLRARLRELWRPLLIMAEAAGEPGVRRELLAVAQEHGADRSELSAEAEALIAILRDTLSGAAEVTIYPGGLAEPLRQRLGWQRPPSAESVASWLRRLGFRRGRQTKDGSEYDITSDALAAVAARYTPPTNCHTATTIA